MGQPGAPVRRMAGFTLVELLVALFIFSIVAALAGSGIVQSLRMQQLNEANTSLQGKLRRITEVISQDLRSTVLGGLANEPYNPTATSISFALADGGQGFQVLQDDYGTTTKRIYSNVAPNVNGRRALIINGSGEATVQTVSSINGPTSGSYGIVHATCTPVAFAVPTRLFVVESVGYAFDDVSGTLSRATVGGNIEPVAFGLSDFRVEYAYVAANGALQLQSTPFFNGTVPLRIHNISGVDYTLQSIQVTISAEEVVAGGRVVERSYVSQIAMPTTGSVNLRSVVSCS